jgi:hypothetical protein
VATAVVIVGVIGEFVAGFTDLFGVREKKERHERIGKISTLLVIAGLAAELLSHNRSSKYSQQINATLNETAAAANEQAAQANRQAGEANRDAGEARRDAAQLQKDADLLRKDAEKERLARVQLETQLDRLRRHTAYRTLTDRQKSVLFSILKSHSPQQLYFISATDPEATSYGDQISGVLNAAGWKTESHPSNWGTVEHYSEGVSVMVADITKPALPAAVILQRALVQVGIEASAVSFGMVGEGHFALYVGLKPKAKD